MVFLLALVLLLVSCSEACPPWTVYSSASGECQCGDGLHGVVHCDRANKQISLKKMLLHVLQHGLQHDCCWALQCNVRESVSWCVEC